MVGWMWVCLHAIRWVNGQWYRYDCVELSSGDHAEREREGEREIKDTRERKPRYEKGIKSFRCWRRLLLALAWLNEWKTTTTTTKTSQTTDIRCRWKISITNSARKHFKHCRNLLHSPICAWTHEIYKAALCTLGSTAAVLKRSGMQDWLVWHKCLLCHELTLSCSSLVKSKQTWLCPEDLGAWV